MKRYLFALVALMTMLFSVNSFAFNPPPPPASGWYVEDLAGALSQAQLSTINHRIDAIRTVTKNEFGVLVLPNMGGSNIEDVANSTFRAWGVGKRGLDNGVLLVIAMQEHKWRIEVGKGVESDLPDLRASDIGQQQLVPMLRRGDVAGGIVNTLNALDVKMESRINQQAAPPVPVAVAPVIAQPVVTQPVADATNTSSDNSSDGTAVAVVLGLLLLAGLVFLVASFRSSRKEEERQEELRRVARAQEAERLRNQTIRNSRPASVPTGTVVTNTPHVHRTYTAPPTYTPPPPPVQDTSGVAIAAAAIAAEEAAETRRREREEERRASEREEANRRRREREEEDERRRRRDDDDSSSSSSSSSSDSGSSWGGGGDSGGGFGGGDSGGGGASGDW